MRVPMSAIDPETGEREYIFQAGQQGAEFYIVLEGSVLVSEGLDKVRKTPSWPRSWANVSLS